MKLKLLAKFAQIIVVWSFLPMALCSCSWVRHYREVRRNHAIYMVLDDHDTQTLKKYLARGLDPNCIIAETNQERPVYPTVDGAPLIFHAIVRDEIEIAALLLAYGADVNARNKMGITPLFCAADQGDLDSIQWLVEHGADVNAVTPKGFNVIVVCVDAYKRFKHRAQENPNDSYYKTKIDAMKPVLEYLAAHGADVNRKDNFLERTPKDFADSTSNTEMSMLLTRLGGVNGNRTGILEYEKTHGPEEAGWFIDLAINAGRWDVADRYLARGFDPNGIVDTKDNWTLLHYAASNNDPKLVERLIASGAKIESKTRGGMTPLDVASGNDAIEVVKLLFRHGAKINGQTPLVAACGEGLSEMAKILLTHGADVNAKSENGFTALHAAVNAIEFPHLGKNKAVPNPFLKENPETQLPDEHRNIRDVIELLFKSGADVNAVDIKYGTAVDTAVKNRFPEMVELLKAHGGKSCQDMGYHKGKIVDWHGKVGIVENGWVKDGQDNGKHTRNTNI